MSSQTIARDPWTIEAEARRRADAERLMAMVRDDPEMAVTSMVMNRDLTALMLGVLVGRVAELERRADRLEEEARRR